MTDKAYTLIVIDGRQYHTTPTCARMMEAVLQDERYQAMFAIPFDWLRMTVSRSKPRKDGQGGAVTVSMEGG